MEGTIDGEQPPRKSEGLRLVSVSSGLNKSSKPREIEGSGGGMNLETLRKLAKGVEHLEHLEQLAALSRPESGARLKGEEEQMANDIENRLTALETAMQSRPTKSWMLMTFGGGGFVVLGALFGLFNWFNDSNLRAVKAEMSRDLIKVEAALESKLSAQTTQLVSLEKTMENFGKNQEASLVILQKIDADLDKQRERISTVEGKLTK